MAGRAIAFTLQNLPGILLVIAIACASQSRRGTVPERFLSWLLLLPIGVSGLWSGFFHLAYPQTAAHFIGWADSPFQFEVGMADLALGAAGCIAFFADFGFRAAAVLVNAIFLFGDAIGHVLQMLATGNVAPGNAGLVFYLDVLLPIVTLSLLFICWRNRSND